MIQGEGVATRLKRDAPEGFRFVRAFRSYKHAEAFRTTYGLSFDRIIHDERSGKWALYTISS